MSSTKPNHNSELTPDSVFAVGIADYNVRLHKALVEVWPLAQHSTIPRVRNMIEKAVSTQPDESIQMARSLLFAAQNAWIYVHSGPGEVVSEKRIALQREFREIMRSTIPRHMTEEQAEAEGRLIVTIRDRNGAITSQQFGHSPAESLSTHEAGDCGVTCSHCHQALADEIGEDAAVATMYFRAFGKEMPQPNSESPSP